MIPTEIAGYPVSEIASEAFSDRAVKKIILPRSIMKVSPNAIPSGCKIYFIENGFVYRVEDGEAVINDYIGDESIGSLPKELAGIPVSDASINPFAKEDFDNTADFETNNSDDTSVSEMVEATLDEAEDDILEEEIKVEGDEEQKGERNNGILAVIIIIILGVSGLVIIWKKKLFHFHK